MVSGPTLYEAEPRVVEFKLFQDARATEECRKSSTLGRCCGFELKWDMAENEIEAVISAFAEPSHFFQVVHHMAVSLVENAVYCVCSAVHKGIIRLVLLNVPEDILELYRKCMNDLANGICNSGAEDTYLVTTLAHQSLAQNTSYIIAHEN